MASLSRVHTIEADYLVAGAGAMGMAFVDTLVTESDARVVLVDRNHQPGGHWTMAYPFVRLHQPSAFYGVNSRGLGSGSIDQVGWNAGLFELATAGEVCAYYDHVMRRQLLPTGRLTYFPMSEYRGEGRFGSGRITLQSVRGCQQVFSAALIAHVEAAYADDDSERNRLCRPVEHPDTDLDWARNTLADYSNQLRWLDDPELTAWLAGARPDLFGRLLGHPPAPASAKPRVRDRVLRMTKTALSATAEKLEQLLGGSPESCASGAPMSATGLSATGLSETPGLWERRRQGPSAAHRP